MNPTMPTRWPVRTVPVPTAASIRGLYDRTDLADAYAVRLPAQASRDPEQLARFVVLNQAPWVNRLMQLRDALVGPLGLKTAQQLQGGPAPSMADKPDRIGIFRIYRKTANELVLGEDDSHLDFRLSVLLEPVPNTHGEDHQLTLSTVVHCHNRLGRAYIALIAPFHRAIVQAALRGASRKGWPMRSPNPATLEGAPWTP